MTLFWIVTGYLPTYRFRNIANYARSGTRWFNQQGWACGVYSYHSYLIIHVFFFFFIISLNPYSTKLSENVAWYTAVTSGGRMCFYPLMTFSPPVAFSLASSCFLLLHFSVVTVRKWYEVCSCIVCVHAFTRCANSCPDEWDFSHESAWMSDLSGFKKTSE